MIFHRILASALPVWTALGWRCVGGVWISSLAEHECLVEWSGDGEPRMPPSKRGDSIATEMILK